MKTKGLWEESGDGERDALKQIHSSPRDAKSLLFKGERGKI